MKQIWILPTWINASLTIFEGFLSLRAFCCCFHSSSCKLKSILKRSIHIILNLSILHFNVDVNVNMSTGQIYGRKWFNTLTRAQSTLAFLINVYTYKRRVAFAIFLTFNKFSEWVCLCVRLVRWCIVFYFQKKKRKETERMRFSLRHAFTHRPIQRWNKHGTV